MLIEQCRVPWPPLYCTNRVHHRGLWAELRMHSCSTYVAHTCWEWIEVGVLQSVGIFDAVIRAATPGASPTATSSKAPCRSSTCGATHERPA